jgi:hypothetical protein
MVGTTAVATGAGLVTIDPVDPIISPDFADPADPPDPADPTAGDGLTYEYNQVSTNVQNNKFANNRTGKIEKEIVVRSGVRVNLIFKNQMHCVRVVVRLQQQFS